MTRPSEQDVAKLLGYLKRGRGIEWAGRMVGLSYFAALALARRLVRQGELPAGYWARKKRAWALEEVLYLRENWGTVPDEKIAKRLGRTLSAVRQRANYLRVSRKEHFETPFGLAKALGVSPCTVVSWIKRGLLEGAKSEVVRAGRHRVWRIESEAVETFIMAHPECYDLRRIDPGAFPRLHMLARGVDKLGAPKLVRKWTEWEDAFLLNHHDELSNAELGRRIRRTKEAVHYRKEVLRQRGYLIPYRGNRGVWGRSPGKRLQPASKQVWTREQDAYLREHWNPHRGGEVARSVGHTKLACSERVKELGICRGRGFRSDLVAVRAAEGEVA